MGLTGEGVGLESISPEKIHFLPRHIFRKFFPEAAEESIACSSPESSGIYVNRDNCVDEEGFLDRRYLFRVLLHEELEILGYRKYFLETKGTIFKRIMAERYRQGYRVFHPGYDEERAHEHFRGLKEAVIEKMIEEFFERHGKEIEGLEERRFVVPEEVYVPGPEETERKERVGEKPLEYSAYKDVLERVISKIAMMSHEDEGNVWKIFKKGLFTGEMLHLREVDKVFGTGSLRILAVLGSQGVAKEELPEQEINYLVREYFETDDLARREKIAEEVLNNEELERYRRLKDGGD